MRILSQIKQEILMVKLLALHKTVQDNDTAKTIVLDIARDVLTLPNYCELVMAMEDDPEDTK